GASTSYDDGGRAACVGRSARREPGHTCRHAIDPRLLEAGMEPAGGSVHDPLGESPRREAGPGPQDRRVGCGVDRAVAATRVAAGEPGAARTDSGIARSD